MMIVSINKIEIKFTWDRLDKAERLLFEIVNKNDKPLASGRKRKNN